MNLDDRKDAGSDPASRADSRRDAMKKIAIYSAYATPTLLALMHSKKAHAITSIVET